METPLPGHLTLTADWQSLDKGSPEERACFAAIRICWNGTILTEGHDTLVNVVREAPNLSAYHLAEWLVWNWWRLRWEPNASYPEWRFGHCVSTIGGGYLWPKIFIFSDGERTVLITRPTSEDSNTPYKYLKDTIVTISSTEFEAAVDQFVEAVRGRLREEHVGNTNLDLLWSDITAERQDSRLMRRRKLEALLGCEPDEGDGAILESLLADSEVLGEAAVSELAAGHSKEGAVLNLESLQAIASRDGFDASPRDAFRFERGTRLTPISLTPAWKLGVEAARTVREQASLGNSKIPDDKLAELVAVNVAAIHERNVASSLAFALDNGSGRSKIILRSKWETGRRFELARILGDRVLAGTRDRLFPATRAHTYRQKMQRSFAAELLSPFEEVIVALDGDYSDDAQQEVAESFDVSPLTIRTMLVNNGRIERNEMGEDLGAIGLSI